MQPCQLSAKTPVQKWQTIHIQTINVEKSKHVHIDVGGPNPINLHFSVGSKDNADAIVTKLQSSKEMSTPSPASSPPPDEPSTPPRQASPPKEAKKASVHFAPESPTVIPVSDDEEEPQAAEEEADAEEEEGDVATALYDFAADGADELSVAEGERLLIIERDGVEWWKCRNAKGGEGVVPASYLEVSCPSSSSKSKPKPRFSPRRALIQHRKSLRQRRRRRRRKWMMVQLPARPRSVPKLYASKRQRRRNVQTRSAKS